MPAGDDTLATVRLFAGLDPEERGAIARRCRFRRFRAGETLLRRGDPAGEVLFLLDGRLEVVESGPSGRGVVLATVEAGGHVGELAALDGGPRSADVVAATDGRLASLDRAGFLALLERHPRLALGLLGDCARMIRLSNLRTVELAGSRVVARLARELLRLSRDEGGRRIVRPAPTQEQLARRLATTRESVARAAGRLVRAGLLRRRGRTLELADPRTLEAVAEGETAPGS